MSDFLIQLSVVVVTVFRGWQARSLYSRLTRLTVVQENNVKNFLGTVSLVQQLALLLHARFTYMIS